MTNTGVQDISCTPFFFLIAFVPYANSNGNSKIANFATYY